MLKLNGLLNGYRISDGDNKKVLEIVVMQLWMQLMPLNYILKWLNMVKMTNFILHVWPQLKKLTMQCIKNHWIAPFKGVNYIICELYIKAAKKKNETSETI